LGTVTVVPSVQVTTAPPSVAVTEQEVPFVPGCPAAPLPPEHPARRSTAKAAKGTDARTRLSFDMTHLVFRRPVPGTMLLCQLIAVMNMMGVMAA
jgi:hypothetical protein